MKLCESRPCQRWAGHVGPCDPGPPVVGDSEIDQMRRELAERVISQSGRSPSPYHNDHAVHLAWDLVDCINEKNSLRARLRQLEDLMGFERANAGDQ